MKNLILLMAAFLLSVGGFAAEPCVKKKCKAILGTNTIVITISIDEQGNPLPNVTELLVLKPGHRIVFTGPEEFSIFLRIKRHLLKKPNFDLKMAW